MTAALALQQAVRAALRGTPALAGWPVVDGADGGTPLPYVGIGPDMVRSIGGTGVRLHRHRFAVTLWMAGAAVSRLKPAMAEAERAVLLLQPDLGEARLVRLSFLRSETRRDVRAGAVSGSIDFEAVIEG
ncbi:DUF3168 domain-containing protein [Pacificimonas flava]|uniref:DUF3168 domain-containing protein n=1 Tax=Pacificimonas flava TaxID=1234595 RepID=M2TLD7_9SPHN|nr:DUF3168 domain-containing protein [Pacificimonas flava]EMD82481.1 hypothetical protein C725_2202 [Pacificimonas flava]MBB5281313.1 hypothetical protein [Pacificimonas flava]